MTLGSGSSTRCKEDSPYKAPDYDERVLSELDQFTVEVAIGEFEAVITGEDVPQDEEDGDGEGTEDEDEGDEPDGNGDDVDDNADPVGLDFSQLKDSSEDARYNPLCDALNSFAEEAGTTKRFKIVANRPESADIDFRCDLALYDEDDEQARQAYMRDVASDNPRVARCAWAYMVCPVEVKCKEEDCAYGMELARRSPRAGRARRVPLLRDSAKGKKARAQFAKYATEVMLRQHRTHCFALYVGASAARFFRFDRAGCVVSEPVHLRRDYGRFRRVVVRMLGLSAEDQGFDPTVKEPSAKDVDALKAYTSDKPYLKQSRDIMLQNQLLYPLKKLECPAVSLTASKAPKRKCRLLVGKAASGHVSPLGRCTKGFIAFSLDQKRMVFLKDQWRAVTREHGELDTYRRLHAHSVPFIATPIAGADIGAQRTLSQTLMRNRPVVARPVERVHCRLVTKEVGRPLEDYKDSVDLIQIVSYAVIAHRIAWEAAKILHNDVSAANIMINSETNEGFLNDWDLCKYKEDLKNKVPASQPGGVSGTWPFKSALSLMYPTKPSEVADDLESFIYVILLMAMRFHRHELASDASLDSTPEEQRLANSRNEPLAARFYDIFHEEIRCNNGYSKGGRSKHLYIKVGKPPIELEETEDGPTLLGRFLKMAWILLRRHYKHVDLEELAPYAVAPKTTRSSKDKPRPEDPPTRALRDNSVMAHFAQQFTRYPRQGSPSVSSSGSSGWLIAEERPLDRHDALCWLFDEVFRDESGAPLDLAPLRGDKFFDMCAGQPVMTSTRRKNLNGSHSVLPLLPTIREDDEEEPATRAAKKGGSARTKKATTARKAAAVERAAASTKATVKKRAVATRRTTPSKPPPSKPAGAAQKTAAATAKGVTAKKVPGKKGNTAGPRKAPAAGKAAPKGSTARSARNGRKAAVDEDSAVTPPARPGRKRKRDGDEGDPAPGGEVRKKAAAKHVQQVDAHVGVPAKQDAPPQTGIRRSSRLASKAGAGR